MILIRLGILFLLFYSFSISSQIVIDNNPPYNNPTWLINNILLGGGITATNHTFVGDPNQIGFFNGVNSNLGIDSGVVLSSGNVLDLVGPNNIGSTSTSFFLPGDPTLDAVIFPDLTNDAAVLEFDFIPTSDTIRFKYVFGSEEYLEFVNSFNDAFGFFLTGPNPAGGNYIDQNLAIVPGTVNTPVTINNVNDVVNSAYYVDNGDGFTAPQNTDPTVIQFDGFTTPLTAVAAVNCGDTYHIKLVVADAVDGAYDSGIFLEAGSFVSPALEVSNDLGIDSLVIDIPCNSTIQLTASGGNGATYQWFDSTSNVIGVDSSIMVGGGTYIVSADIFGCAVISDTLVIAEGDSPIFDLGNDLTIPCSSSVSIDPIVSGGTTPYSYLWSNGITDTMALFTEGIYSVIVTDDYGCSYSDTIEILYDLAPSIELGSDITIACNSDTIIGPIITGGTEPYTFFWNNGDTDSLSNLTDGIYSVIVTDFFGCSGTDQIEIFYDSPPDVSLVSDYNIACNTTSTLLPNIIGGTPPYTYLWSNGSTNESVNVGEGSYTVTVYDLYGCMDSDNINITEENPGNVTVFGGEEICEGETSAVTFSFDGLLPWSLEFTDGNINKIISSINDPNFIYNTVESGFFLVASAQDINGCIANYSGSAEIIVNPLPIPIITPNYHEIYPGENIVLSTEDYNYYEWYSQDHFLLDTLSQYTVSDSGIFYVSVIDENGCQANSQLVTVNLIPLTQLFIPSTFTPNDDNHNDLFVISGLSVKVFNIKIFNHWGELLFESEEINKSWDGTYKQKKVPQGTYCYNIDVIGMDDRLFNKSGYIRIIY